MNWDGGNIYASQCFKLWRLTFPNDARLSEIFLMKIQLKGLFHPAFLAYFVSWLAFVVAILMHEYGGHEQGMLVERDPSKDKSGVDKIIVKKQPYQVLNTSREFFPSFHASNIHKCDD